MPDEPLNPLVPLTEAEAARILAAWLGETRRVRRLRRLTGGCVHTVLEAEFEGPESPVVLKVAHRVEEESIRAEHEVLRYFRAHTGFPVPEPHACDITGDLAPYSWLIMERLPGVHLGEARMLPEDEARIQRAMGEAVAGLHDHTRDAGFGHLVYDDEPHPSWPDYFTELLASNYRDACDTGLVAPDDLRLCERVVASTPAHLVRTAVPTLVHGDLWATNIMVAGEPGSMRLTGFLDPGGLFADPEYELAYLEIWHTIDERFFEAYTRRHPLAPGYEHRRLFYWLNTLLLHVWCFRAEHYARATTDLTRRLARDV